MSKNRILTIIILGGYKLAGQSICLDRSSTVSAEKDADDKDQEGWLVQMLSSNYLS